MPTDAPAEQSAPLNGDTVVPAAVPPPSPRSGPAAAPEGGVKETIESILIAFILAFIFRAFVVEAFVIPTGSMAPTLMGAHLRFTCTDCGYDFEANYSSPRSVGDDVNIPAAAEVMIGNRLEPVTYAAHCPNCGLQVPRYLKPTMPPGGEAALPSAWDNDATAPPVHYGDRILVLKYVYELFAPRRWDVVVFKSPDHLEGEPLYSVNYIKRLIGRPNESVMILDGDIYVKPDGSDQFVVQTKPRVAQESLWRVVYDNDFLPRRGDWRQPWRADDAGGWSVGSPSERTRDFTFSRADAGPSWLAFEPDESQANQPLTDWLAYADTRGQGGDGGMTLDNFDNGGLRAVNAASDLKLACFYERRSGAGPLRMELSKRDDTFTAEIYPDRVRLLHRVGSGRDEELFPPAPLDGSGPLRVEFGNVDYQVTLRVNGRDYFRTTPQQYAPDLGFLRRAYDRDQALPPGRARIGAEAQACRLSHVSLWRDVYYTNRDRRNPPSFATPENPVKLGPKEYFVLGDNSLMSGDARYWRYPIDLPHEDLTVDAARVPERFLLGKAFFVYWPAGYRPVKNGPGFVPNFGEMRFIH